MKKFTIYKQRLQATVQRVQGIARGLLYGFTALFVPSKWAHNTIHTFLNAADAEQRDSLTSVFITSTLSTMSTTSLVSALVAGVISGAFSWYNIEQTHWTTRACWYSGLMFALASISAAGLCSGSLLRLMCHADTASRVQQTMGYRSSPTTHEWTPRAILPWIWGTPGMLLKLSVLWFLVGLCLEIWLTAKRAGFSWESDDVKIAAFVTLTSLFAAFSYAIAVVGLFFPTISHDDLGPSGPGQSV